VPKVIKKTIKISRTNTHNISQVKACKSRETYSNNVAKNNQKELTQRSMNSQKEEDKSIFDFNKKKQMIEFIRDKEFQIMMSSH